MNSTCQNLLTVEYRDSVTAEAEPPRTEHFGQRDPNPPLSADFGELGRRSHLEAEKRAAAQKQSFVEGLLPPIDNLERALASGTSTDSPLLRKGAEMALQQLRQLLRLHGIETEKWNQGLFNQRSREPGARRYDLSEANEAILENLQRCDRRGEMVLRNLKPVEGGQTDSMRTRLVGSSGRTV